MSICKHCGNDAELTNSGYCSECYNFLRTDIEQKKSLLRTNAAVDSAAMSQDERTAAIATVNSAKTELDNYKDSVSFFKSDYLADYNAAISNLTAYNHPFIKPRTLLTISFVTLVSLVMVAFIFCFMEFFSVAIVFLTLAIFGCITFMFFAEVLRLLSKK